MDSRSTFLRHVPDRWRDGVWKVRGRIEMSLARVEGSCRKIRSDIRKHRTKTLMFR